MSSEERVAPKTLESSRHRSAEERCEPRASASRVPPDIAILPCDLAARVLATLPPHTRARCASVCRTWREMMRELPPEQLWRELDFVRGADETFKVRPPPSSRTARGTFDKFSQFPLLTRQWPPDAQVNKETVTAAVSAARGKMRVLKVPGEAGISRASLVSLIRDNRESLKELHAHCSTDGERGYWTPKQVHAVMSAAGSRFRRLAVDVKSRGVCLALIQQLACPVVRVRRLDVRAAQLGAVEKVELFGAIARMRSKAAALVRSGSALSLTDIANEYGASGGFRGLGGGEEDEEDTLRCLTLASCGLDRDDAAALADAVAAGIGGDSTDPGVPATIRGLGFGHAAADEHRAPPLNLNLGDNPSLGCVGARAISALVAEGSVATLSLENCGVGELGAAALGEALASPGCVLRSLNIGRNFVGAEGAAAIAAGLARGAKARAAAGLAATLTDLRIGNNAIGCEGMVALASTAARSDAFVALERLEVPMNGIGPDGAAALARSILATPSVPDVGEEDDEEPFTASDVCGAPVLRELFMDGNPLGAVGAAAIANACAAGSADDPRPSLEVLSLSATRLGVSGASALAAAMIIPNGRLSRIAHLDISANDIGESGAGFLRSPPTAVGDDDDGKPASRLDPAGAEDIHPAGDIAEISPRLISLASSLASAPSLRRLDLGYNNLGDAGAGAIASAFSLGLGAGGVELDLQRNSIGDEGAAALARALGECLESAVRSLDLRSNAIGDAGLEALSAHVKAGTARLNFMPARWTVPGPVVPDGAVTDVDVTVGAVAEVAVTV